MPKQDETSNGDAAAARGQERNWWKPVAIVLIVGAVVALAAFLLSSSDDDGVEGEVWVVDQLAVGATSKAPIAGTILTAIFEDGVVSGVAGCNDYFGGYEVEDDTIAITESATTRAFCDEPTGVMIQESTFLGLLQDADRYERDGESLTLKDGDRVLIAFVATLSE